MDWNWRRQREKKERHSTKLQEDRIKSVRKILNETKRDIGQLFLPVSERLQTAVDERAALYGAILPALALAIALRLTTQRSVLKVRRGVHHHRPQLHMHIHTHRLCSSHTQAFLCTGRYKHMGKCRHKRSETCFFNGQLIRNHWRMMFFTG